MLTLTENASTVVTGLVDRQNSAGDAGLRIHAAEETGPAGEPRFAVDVAAPEPDDQIVDAASARVYLEESAAVALSDKVLDASVDAEGAVSFTLLQQ
jgi:Fe-S cluster assembly iron-binding protein IscA